MRRLVLFLVAVGAAACADNSTSPNSVQFRNVAGVYALSTVNGEGLPLLMDQNDTASVQLVRGAITLGSDSSFLDVITVQFDAPSGSTVQDDTITGVYSLSGTTVLFQPTNNTGTYTASVTDSTLVESDPGVTVVYRRQ